MKISVIGMGVLVLLTGLATTALAEPFASHGSLAIGAERIFGVDYNHQTTKDPGSSQENTESSTSFSLLGHFPTTIGALPRLSVDVFLGPGVSVGGSMIYQHRSSSEEASGANGSYDTSTGIYLFSPRVGFGIPLNERFAIWPRLGLTYLYTSSESTNNQQTPATTRKRTEGNWFTTLDALFLISPVEHVAFTVGPALDILIGGPTQTEDGIGVATPDTSAYAIGLHAGLTVWL